MTAVGDYYYYYYYHYSIATVTQTSVRHGLWGFNMPTYIKPHTRTRFGERWAMSFHFAGSDTGTACHHTVVVLTVNDTTVVNVYLKLDFSD